MNLSNIIKPVKTTFIGIILVSLLMPLLLMGTTEVSYGATETKYGLLVSIPNIIIKREGGKYWVTDDDGKQTQFKTGQWLTLKVTTFYTGEVAVTYGSWKNEEFIYEKALAGAIVEDDYTNTKKYLRFRSTGGTAYATEDTWFDIIGDCYPTDGTVGELDRITHQYTVRIHCTDQFMRWVNSQVGPSAQKAVGVATGFLYRSSRPLDDPGGSSGNRPPERPEEPEEPEKPAIEFDAAAALETYVLKREYTYSGEGDVEEQLAGLADQIRTLSASTRQSSTAVTVQEGGYYSALVDGYESVLTPDMLEELSPGQLRSVSPDSSRTSNAGKIIYGNQWHYVALLSEADAGQLWEGAEVSLRFVSGLEKDVPMTVERISTAENGQRLVVLSADRYLSVTTLLRDQSAQIILQSYSGIRVPKTAVRVLDVTRENEAGEEEAVSLTGVYCRVGAAARFKPVDILYQGEDYYLVSPAPDRMGSLSETGRELRTLRNGDEVVVTAKDRYDGKVIG